MDYYVSIDTSLEIVNLCVVDQDGTVCREEKVVAEPEAIAAAFARFGQAPRRVGIEAGPTSSWLVTGLRAVGLPVICLECRHLKARLRAVHVKSEQAQEARMLLVHRSTLLTKLMDIENAIGGTLKVFGLRLGRVTKLTFESRALELLAH